MARSIALTPLDDLVPAVRNPKGHAVEELRASFDRFGYAELIMIDERTGRIVSGHGRLEALAALRDAGEPAPDGVEIKAKRWTVPVVRGWASKDDIEAEAYLVASNQLTTVGGWDTVELLEVLQELDAKASLVGTGFDNADLTALAQSLEVEVTKSTKDPETIPDKPNNPKTKTGDLWRLGDHLLFCGDSFEDGTLERLTGGEPVPCVVTDPPFAIYGSSTGIAADISDDKMVRPFFEALGRVMAEALVEFGHGYICCDWRSWAALWEGTRRGGLTTKNQIVWDKGAGGLGTNYTMTHELIAFVHKSPRQNAMKHSKSGVRPVHRPNILRHDRVTGEERQHNAAKPVGLLEELITNSTDEGDRVLDLFGGSGSTLIAAEKANRRALLVEIEPGWCDVILRRFEDFTGTAPVLVEDTKEDTTP